jgi:TldD protein
MMTRILSLRPASGARATLAGMLLAGTIAVSVFHSETRAESSRQAAAPAQPDTRPAAPSVPPAHTPIDVPGGAPAPQSGKANPPDSAELSGSPVLGAMAHELKRSMDSLRIKGRPRPYFLSYTVWDVESSHMQASLGACEMVDADREHMADVDLRVGDYRQDNTNFSGGIVFGPRLRLPLPQDNDTNLIRAALWAATDAKYKVAVENLAQKRAFLANHNRGDSLPDFSKQKVLSHYRAEPRTPPDTARLRSLGVSLSGWLGGFPWLLESRVGYQYYYTTFYYVDSEGARQIETVKEHTLLVSLFTQAKDGTPMWDYLRMSTRDPLPLGEGPTALGALQDSLRPMLKRLDYLRTAAPVANYRGPVLFTGHAAGELLTKALLTPQAHLREAIGAMSEPNFMVSLRGRKLFPGDITVTDSPSMAAYAGRALFGHYEVDHQGQPARDIVLVENGRVKYFLLGKAPVLKGNGSGSNGHWRYGGGFPGVTQLRSAKPTADSALRSQLASMGADEGTGYGLIVGKLADDDALKLLRHPLAGQLAATDALDGRGSFSLTPPCELDMLDSRTGKVTPVRGLSFPALDTKSLRDIAAVGDKPWLHEPLAAYSVLCPSLLFTLLDLKGARSNQPHPPYFP